MTRGRGDATTVDEDVFVSHLEAEMPEFRHLRHKRRPVRLPPARLPSRQRVTFTVVFTSGLRRAEATQADGGGVRRGPHRQLHGGSRLLPAFLTSTAAPAPAETNLVSVSQQATLSKRQVTKGEARMTCGLVITSEPAATGVA